MVKTYTDRWNDFQFREPVYLDGRHRPYEFDLVKWVAHKPYATIDGYTGEPAISTEHCFSVGRLIWDPKEEDFDFEACGLRYFEYHVNGLEQFILDFCNMMKEDLLNEED